MRDRRPRGPARRRARKAAHDKDEIIVVEGYVDVIAMSQAGYPQTVAPLGTALTGEQCELLWRIASEPILCFDGDKAGQKAAFRAIDTALPARALLELAQRIEAAADRVRTVRNGPRTLDVDVLLVGDLSVCEPDLVVPHPRMSERGFVLAPLEDLDASQVPEGWRGRLAESDPASLDLRLIGSLGGH